MLSRLASRALLQSQPLVSRPLIVGVQNASSVPTEEPKKSGQLNPGLEDPLDKYPRIYAKKTEGPERDLVNFPRPVQKEHPDPVRLGFIPEEFFDFFYKKTGVSGPYVLGAGFFTWLLSKEIVVIDHNFNAALGFIAVMVVAQMKLGPKLAELTDNEIKKWENRTRDAESAEKVAIKNHIEGINKYAQDLDVVKDLMDAKREVAAAALEVTYREWSHKAYQEVKKRLDYQLELANVERRISQKNMSSWISDNVLKAITPAQEAEALKKCISDLKALSASA